MSLDQKLVKALLDEKLARVRATLADARARDEAKGRVTQHNGLDRGRWVSHPDVGSHERLASHLVGPGHRMALRNEWRTSTKNMQLAHANAHTQRPVDHDAQDVER